MFTIGIEVNNNMFLFHILNGFLKCCNTNDTMYSGFLFCFLFSCVVFHRHLINSFHL